MRLKYIGPKPGKILDARWGSLGGKQYSFTPPSMACEVAEKDAKVLLAECSGLFAIVIPEDTAKIPGAPEPVKAAEVSEPPREIPPKFIDHFGRKRGRPKKNGIRS